RLRTNPDQSTPGPVRIRYAIRSVQDAAGGKVRATNRTRLRVVQVDQLGLRVVNQDDERVDDLSEIVRRDVRRHSDRDSAGTIDQEIRELRGKDQRLLQRPVEVVHPVDGVLLEVLEH